MPALKQLNHTKAAWVHHAEQWSREEKDAIYCRFFAGIVAWQVGCRNMRPASASPVLMMMALCLFIRLKAAKPARLHIVPEQLDDLFIPEPEADSAEAECTKKLPGRSKSMPPSYKKGRSPSDELAMLHALELEENPQTFSETQSGSILENNRCFQTGDGEGNTPSGKDQATRKASRIGERESGETHERKKILRKKNSRSRSAGDAIIRTAHTTPPQDLQVKDVLNGLNSSEDSLPLSKKSSEYEVNRFKDKKSEDGIQVEDPAPLEKTHNLSTAGHRILEQPQILNYAVEGKISRSPTGDTPGRVRFAEDSFNRHHNAEPRSESHEKNHHAHFSVEPIQIPPNSIIKAMSKRPDKISPSISPGQAALAQSQLGGIDDNILLILKNPELQRADSFTTDEAPETNREHATSDGLDSWLHEYVSHDFVEKTHDKLPAELTVATPSDSHLEVETKPIPVIPSLSSEEIKLPKKTWSLSRFLIQPLKAIFKRIVSKIRSFMPRRFVDSNVKVASSSVAQDSQPTVKSRSSHLTKSMSFPISNRHSDLLREKIDKTKPNRPTIQEKASDPSESPNSSDFSPIGTTPIFRAVPEIEAEVESIQPTTISASHKAGTQRTATLKNQSNSLEKSASIPNFPTWYEPSISWSWMVRRLNNKRKKLSQILASLPESRGESLAHSQLPKLHEPESLFRGYVFDGATEMSREKPSPIHDQPQETKMVTLLQQPHHSTKRKRKKKNFFFRSLQAIKASQRKLKQRLAKIPLACSLRVWWHSICLPVARLVRWLRKLGIIVKKGVKTLGSKISWKTSKDLRKYTPLSKHNYDLDIFEATTLRKLR
ncbi:hypothetical protein O181_004638 [Austropuccinia psidii MF-1]|uniref:Uncharacterized protein n=1 Tax=Austropuccinia psidii MF-1 TaxID=1389203 RepID=A0A9Q3BH03_9BASI|nr:hypothetical protein [Austropuccinia psidii MF-1]